MIEQKLNPLERELLESLNRDQLQLVADWLDAEKLIRVEEGYRHSDLIWSLTWMAHNLRVLAQISNPSS